MTAQTIENLQRVIECAMEANLQNVMVGIGLAQNIDEENRTCEIKVNDDLTLFNCRLNAVLDAFESRVLIVPKDQSPVAYIAVNGNLTDPLIIAYSEIEKVLLLIGDTTMTIDGEKATMTIGNTSTTVEDSKLQLAVGQVEIGIESDKLSIKKGGVSLFDLLDGLLQGILALTVPTGTGPSGTPINATSFTELKTKLTQIMQ